MNDAYVLISTDEVFKPLMEQPFTFAEFFDFKSKADDGLDHTPLMKVTWRKEQCTY